MKKKKINKRFISTIAVTILMALVTFLLMTDCFHHGFYCNEVSLDSLEAENTATYDLSNDLEISFSPAKKHFAGFEICLANQPAGNQGSLILTTYTSKNKRVESITVDLSKVGENQWYIVQTNGNYKKGEVYTLKFEAKDCTSIPALRLVDSQYLSSENIDNNVLLSYAYGEPTFTITEKILFLVGFLAVYVFTVGKIWHKDKYCNWISIYLILSSLFTWNYIFNTFDINCNKEDTDWFSGFQSDSESLVINRINCDRSGMLMDSSYGLCNRIDAIGTKAYTGDGWSEGYSTVQPMIRLADNDFTANAVVEGGSVTFANGVTLTITGISKTPGYIDVQLNSENILSSGEYGKLNDASFSGGILTGKEIYTEYTSQYGLQGKIFRFLANYISDYLPVYYALNSFALAMILVGIGLLLFKKWNALLGICFLFTFAVSPWIVSFARNLYWVEFTWFAPMFVGLVSSIWIRQKKIRLMCYLGSFVSVLIKCLCGYEYITTVMMGLIMFLLVDFIVAILKKDKEAVKLTLQTILINGCMALLGFAVAISLHALIRGNGDLFNGIKSIIEYDALRRTSGGDMNVFDQAHYWGSFNASIWETICIYFHFNTEILPGLAGNLFPLLFIIPIFIFVLDARNHSLNKKDVALYIIAFLTTVSWFVLGKAHSYVHQGMNYVLWYFGFIQVCIYVILKKIFPEKGHPVAKDKDIL